MAEDWEATCLIYDDTSHQTSTIVDDAGHLLRGTIEVVNPLTNLAFCRLVTWSDPEQYRFWTLKDQMRFRLVFWCNPVVGKEQVYERLDITLLSQYPHSFPQESKNKWLEWMKAEATAILREEQLSYSVCSFVEYRSLEFFTPLYQTNNINLIFFDDDGPTFYDMPTIVADHIKSVLPLKRHYSNGSYKNISNSAQLCETELKYIFPFLIKWAEWLPIQCPICFDKVSPKEAATITCGHAFCHDCISTYLRLKAQELNAENQHNPFTCPVHECRRGLKIVACVKQFLNHDLMDKVRCWYKDVKNPPCWSLPQCLKRDCTNVMLRREAVDSYIVYCEQCNGRWCELCLKRTPQGKHEKEIDCKLDVCLQFCERYLSASEKAQERCEKKWPWIKVYAKSRIHDETMFRWIQANGQVCPGCKTGIERVEGCFHMSCQCGTHFCYECGEQIFPPFYGTHHCWEKQEILFG